MERRLGKAGLLGLFVVVFVMACQKNLDKTLENSGEVNNEVDSPKILRDFVQVNLVGDNNLFNPANVDPVLINAWGVVFPTTGPAWVTSFGTGGSAVYNGDGTVARPPVSIPSHSASTGGHPTGIVFNSNPTDFTLPGGSPVRFIFAQADGLISGWNAGTEAVKMVDDSSGAVYLGIALANDRGDNFLYAANFSQGKIDVFDKNWKKIDRPFVDPGLERGYVPLNIQNIDGKLYVMYGQPGTGEDVISPRNGVIDIFNPDGSFVKRFITQGQLNAPWGIAKAPAGFWGKNANTGDIILVGNFGDGHINAYSSSGVFLGQLREQGKPIEIDRLWGIAFAPSSSATIDHNSLYFAAGPGKEQHGLFGLIRKEADQY